MKKITVLSPETAQKIAAGEVIERPASAVKELVENSLDAGATDIRVELLDGGKKLIKVQDNGEGMSQEDAVLCFRRHSTSKIAADADLDRIATLGFRGEALASISAVSRLTLKTSDGGDRGTQVEREADRLLGISDIAFPRGTTVEVGSLFYNLPARLKFLRSERSELGFISTYLTHAALAYPGVRFVIVHGSREIMNCPPVAGLRERIFQLYGKAVLDNLMDVDYAEDGFRIEGFSSTPVTGRAGRSRQLFYVNRRPVKDRMLQAALNQAYRSFLEKDKSAEAFLFLTLPFAEVDVNVHPAKAEVRFRDSQAVFRLVLRGIEKAMLRISRIKEIYPRPEKESAGPGPRVEEEAEASVFGSFFPDAGDRTRPAARPAAAAVPGPPGRSGPAVLGQYENMYIVAASAEGLLIIDQHNAHERVLFEKYLRIDGERSWPRKMLLIPALLELSPTQELSLESSREPLEDMGFRVEPMGGRSYALKEYPDIFKDEEAEGVFLALLEEAGSGEGAALGRREKFLATLACKTAVKAGEPLPYEKMEFLVDELFKTPRSSLCPHGRPIVVRIEKSQIDKGLRRPSN